MRLFIALDIDESIRQRIARFLEGVRDFGPAARWVREESLHVTLKFIGQTPDEAVPRFEQALAGLHRPAFDVAFRGYGFFPTPKSARVFWIGIESGAGLTSLATAIDDITAGLDVPRETHAFSPHLTLARKSRGSGAPGKRHEDAPNKVFRRLQEKLSAMPTPEFGTMTAREFFLYQSQLSRSGSRYSKLHRFALDPQT
ncbi:MAG TPA: RNA 2',3'-cyclic phosphodiesterase [Terriglobales bacterium]|nr:RNA 2',3'-cyclic phosphodiesterase [Terriglobales bacterium]